MFKLDNEFLTSLGLGGLPVDEKNKLLQHIYERLEMNVGMRLAEKMTDQQLDEFEGFIDKNDEAGALKWLESNFPNYKQVVAEELEKLKQEVSQAAPQILAAAQNVPVAPPQPQYPHNYAPQPGQFQPQQDMPQTYSNPGYQPQAAPPQQPVGGYNQTPQQPMPQFPYPPQDQQQPPATPQQQQ